MLASGTHLGTYEIVAPLGAGGMGEVYRARDRRLKREVALKILPESFAADPDRLARFQREAEVLAALNHPNIAAIYGLEESSGIRALVMELVEGPTLADRIAQGPMPVDEALVIARQIAEALETAHEQGIIHRDLKPANIKLRPDGAVKVLDFGLAKALESPMGLANASQSPTLGVGATRGVILGTAAYMAPEQARGKAVDERADIWAFGCVLYEMLTGRQAFPGDSISDSIASILTKEPDWGTLPALTTPRLRRILRRCLDKNPRDRLHDMSDVRLEVADALQPEGNGEWRHERPAPTRHWRLATAVLGALLAGAALAIAVTSFLTEERPAAVTRLSIALSGPQALVVGGLDRDLALSPDGTRLVYIGGNGSQLFVRRLDSLVAAPLGEVSAPRGLFTSPDGAWVGFFDGVGTLKKIAIDGGPAITLCQCGTAPRGATWGPDGSIIVANNDPASGLWRISEAGGEPAVLTMPSGQPDDRDHFWPEFLPDGNTVLFTIVPNGALDSARVAVLDLRTGTQKVLLKGGTHAHYLASGHIVYASATGLRAVGFDRNQLEIVGTPTPVVPEIATTADGAADFDVALNGTLVYVSSTGGALARTLTWVDRSGREEPIRAPARAYTYPRISPDGTRLAVGIRDQEQDIWIWDFARETLSRFTFEPSSEWYPLWTPDGRRLIFDSARGGAQNLYWQDANGTGPAERLTESPNQSLPVSISPDGSRVVFRINATTQDMALLHLTGARRTEPLIQTSFQELNGEIAPDGRWIAYESNESGRTDIYVRPFPDVTTGRWQISTEGGSRPLWARSGDELFYVTPTGVLMSVRVEKGSSWVAGSPTRVLDESYYFGGGGSTGRTYDISPDGRRFLMVKRGGTTEQAGASVIVVQNWFEELKRLVPTN